MNHASPHVLGRLRWALVSYSALLLVGYGVVAFGLGKGLDGAYGLTPVLAIFVLSQLIYELLAEYFIFKDNYWVKACASLVCACAQTFILMEATGVYNSPVVFIVMILVFLAGAMGLYAAISIVVMLWIGFLLGVTGFFSTPTDAVKGLGLLLINSALVGLGHLVWRHYYLGPDTSTVTLSSSLSKEQAKSDIILNAIEDGVILMDTNRTIRLFNPGASAITGWPVEEAVGLDHHVVLRLVDEKNEEYDEKRNPFERVFDQTKTVRDNQATLVSRSNKRISINISVSPLLDQDGHISGAVGVFRDVSEERSEEQRRAEFISTASHEMRTPVAAIEGYLALALNDRVSKIDSKAREFLEKAHASTQHLGKLFQDLLTSAKAEDGRLSNHPVIVEMGEYLEKLTDDLRFTAEKKGLHIEFVVGTADQVIDASHSGVGGSSRVVRPLYYVYVDPERMREVITNLFDNAVKYTETGGVSIGLTGNDEVVQMYVRDTGPGIPIEDIPHLFQKFYRVDSSTTRTIGGTGLGLFISRKIIELYNGRIWVESKIGQGSTFFINLPRLTTQRASQLQEQAANSLNQTNQASPPKPLQ